MGDETTWRVIYDEARLVAVAKPCGLTVEELAAACGRRPVHRIDKATSGLVLLADDARTVQRMQRLLRDARVVRRYLLVAHGAVAPGAYTEALVEDRGDGLRGEAPPGGAGKAARTDVDAVDVAADGRASVAVASLVTGRTHQIRIHLAARGTPLVGERVYIRDHRAQGRLELSCPRLLLHAWQLAFTHPTTHAPILLALPPPQDFRDAAAGLGVDVDAIAERFSRGPARAS